MSTTHTPGPQEGGNIIEKYDKYFAELIADHCHSEDVEVNHSRADEYLIQVLLDLGLSKTVDEWQKVQKWYA